MVKKRENGFKNDPKLLTKLNIISDEIVDKSFFFPLNENGDSVDKLVQDHHGVGADGGQVLEVGR